MWGHHFAVINYVLFYELATFARVIHFCLGSLEPLESAVPYHDAVSLFLVNSTDVKNMLINKDGVDERKILVSPNSAETSYFSEFTSEKRKLKKIGVVSNHVRDEVRGLQPYLAVVRHRCRIYGHGEIPRIR